MADLQSELLFEDVTTNPIFLVLKPSPYILKKCEADSSMRF